MSASEHTYQIPSLHALPAVAAEFWEQYGHHSVFLISGDLGAGKTTFVQAIGAILEVNEEVLSPTYTIVNEYATATGGTVYHADLYRLDSLEAALEVGMEDYLYSGHPCFIEWPALIEPVLPPKFVKLALNNHPSHAGRILTVEAHG